MSRFPSLYIKICILLFCSGVSGCVSLPIQEAKAVASIPIHFHSSLSQELVDLIIKELEYARISVVTTKLDAKLSSLNFSSLNNFPLVIANYVSSSDSSKGLTQTLYTFRSEVDLCILVSAQDQKEASSNAYTRCRKYLPLGKLFNAKLQSLGSHSTEFIKGELHYSDLQKHATKIHEDIAQAISRYIVQNIQDFKNITPLTNSQRRYSS